MSSDTDQGFLKIVVLVIIAISAVMTVISALSGFIMDYYWFKSVGYLSVFMKNLNYQVALFLIGWAITTTFLLLSWGTIRKALGDQLPDMGSKLYKGIAVLLGVLMGNWLSGSYLTVLKFLNQSPWGVTDPIFGHDVSFYVFTLPFLRTVLAFVGGVAALVLFLCLLSFVLGSFRVEISESGVKYFDYSSESGKGWAWHPFRFLGSWSIVGSVAVLTVVGAISVWLFRFSYLWSFNPGAQIPTGAGFMAVNYYIPYTWIQALGVLLLGGLVIHVLRNLRQVWDNLETEEFGLLKKEIGVLVAVVAIFIIIPGAVFGAVNTISVQPNEPGIQQPYLERTINYTKQAYDLDGIKEVAYTSNRNLSSEEALQSPTVENARIIDYRPVQTTYKEKQRLRTYYEFPEIDLGRYITEEGKKLTVISNREMDYEGGRGGGGWQNQHLFFTHGFGAVVSPASEVQPDGSPVMKLKNIPPESDWKVTSLDEPRIYYGEITDDYTIVKANELNEFDYPMGEENIQYRYEHDSGINLDSTWKKLVAWFYTGDFNILVSGYVGEESQMLLHRNVQDRAQMITPFMSYDSNAHPFIKNGSLYYLLHGITWAEKYPYSYSSSNVPGYLSDSVKCFIKSNTGEINFYIINEDDPMAQTFSSIYPNLFKDGEEMTDGDRSHLVYPQGLFNIQTNLFKRYHMEDYQSFYQKEDMWQSANELYHGTTKEVEPYNVLLDLTGYPGFEDRSDEFTLIKPFTPEGKNNMRAWLGVAQDPGNYGKMIAFKFPKGELARGPMQVESIIGQDTEISRQFTLWEGAGNSVLRGNLLVLPVKGDILYIEPIYLSSKTLPYPQMKRVIAVHEDDAAMAGDLRTAVLAALGETQVQVPGENVTPVKVLEGELAQNVKQYLELRQKYYQLLSEQEYTEAAKVQENMSEVANEMGQMVGE